MGCTIRPNRHGYLAVRVWGFTDPQGRVLDSNEGTGFKDSPANRALLAADVAVIRAEIAAGRFDYLRWFPNGNKAAVFRPQPSPAGITIEQYKERWLPRKLASPDVRKSCKRDYERHLRWAFPKVGSVRLALTRVQLEDLRDWLRRGGKSFKTTRNIIDGTLRAMYRDAVAEGVIPLPAPGQHPFETLKWKKREEDEPAPDPYTAHERELILRYFHEEKRRYHALVVLLFWTGLRLSEAFGLQWRDVDFKRKKIVIRRSRTCGEDNAPKTKYSKREITPLPIVLDALAAYRGKRFPNPTEHVFWNLRKKPLNDHGWMKDHWTPALEAVNVRHRPAYNTRHTFITHALVDGWTTHEVARYCGTSPRMIDEHYAGVIKSSLDEKIARMDAMARLGTVPKAASASEEN